MENNLLNLDNKKSLQDYWNSCMDTIELDFWQNEKESSDRRTFVIGYFTALRDNAIITKEDYINVINELAMYDAF